MTRTLPRHPRISATPARWKTLVLVGGALALVVGALGVKQARVDAERRRAHQRELDAIAEERRRDKERFFSPAEREEIDRAAKRLNESNDRH